MAWLIILFGLWTFPIISYFVFKLSQNRSLKFRKAIFIVTAIASLLTVLSLLTNISTTVSEFDWLLLTSLYFLLCLCLWWTQFQSNKMVKLFGVVLLVVVFGMSYFSGSIGALGVAFVTAEYETDYEKWLGDGLIYKESVLGNAISDHRGKKVEVYKTLKWLPLIEWSITKKTYNNLITYGDRLDMDYKKTENKIYLSKMMQWGIDNKTYHWSDTISLAK